MQKGNSISALAAEQVSETGF